MWNRLKKSLLLRVALAMSVIISLAVVGMVSSVFIAETSEGFAAAINQAGTLRMQSYRIASSLSHHQATDTPYSTNSTPYLMEEFEQRLHSDRIHNIVSTVANPSVLQAYKTVENQWNGTMQPTLTSYIKSTRGISSEQTEQQAIDALRKAYLLKVDGFVDDIHHFVKVLEEQAEQQIQLLRLIQIFALVLTLIVIMVVMHLMHKGVVLPLHELVASARAIRKGDFSFRTHLPQDDELGQLGSAFNMMSENLSRMYAELEDRVKQKTADLERSNRSLELLYMTTKRLSATPVTREVMADVIHDIEKQIGIRSGTVCLGKPGDQQAYKMASTAIDDGWNVINGNEQDCQRCFGDGAPHVFNVKKNTDQEHSIYSIPILDQDKHYGVLLVELENETMLEDWKQRLLETVASHIALAINMANSASQSRMLALSEERSVIARELHDSIAQSLSYLKIQVTRLEKAISENASEENTLKINRGIRDAINEAYRQLRELLTTFRLRVNDAGLTVALEDTVQEFRERGEVDIELVNRTANCQFSPNAEIHLIHIIREALSNILNHAQAKKARVLLQCDIDGKATLLVEDNGIGIQDDHEVRDHYGLSILKERAKGLGGELKIRKLPEGGTSVRLTFII